jgi:hypothetical protein
MILKSTLFSVTLSFFVIISFSTFVYSFNTQDLAGNWHGHHVVTGDAPNDDPRWGYGVISINGSGIYTSSWTSPTQANEISSGTIQISSMGVITVDHQALTHGIMSADKDFIVFVDGTSESKGHALTFLCKRETNSNFNTNVIAGSWYGYQIVSGDGPSDDPRWGYGSLTINNQGIYTATWNSPTQTNQITSGSIQVNSDGIFTINNQPLTHGVISDDHDLMVLIDGTSQSAGNLFMILFKQDSNTSFNSADLAGTWLGHNVVSGDAPVDEPRWGYGNVSIDNSGKYTVSWNSLTSTNEISSGDIQITTNGIISINNNSLIHGAMNIDKNLFIFVDGTNETKGNALNVFTKSVPTVQTGPNLLLLH